jgi:hypothetical protein
MRWLAQLFRIRKSRTQNYSRRTTTLPETFRNLSQFLQVTTKQGRSCPVTWRYITVTVHKYVVMEEIKEGNKVLLF